MHIKCLHMIEIFRKDFNKQQNKSYKIEHTRFNNVKHQNSICQ